MNLILVSSENQCTPDSKGLMDETFHRMFGPLERSWQFSTLLFWFSKSSCLHYAVSFIVTLAPIPLLPPFSFEGDSLFHRTPLTAWLECPRNYLSCLYTRSSFSYFHESSLLVASIQIPNISKVLFSQLNNIFHSGISMSHVLVSHARTTLPSFGFGA